MRTDFSDEPAWESLCVAIREPVGEFRAYVECISDREYEGLKAEDLSSIIGDGNATFAFIVDGIALSDPDHPILVVDLERNSGRTFRVIPSEMWSVENNLSLGNMDFGEFANAVDEGGVFRGFRD